MDHIIERARTQLLRLAFCAGIALTAGCADEGTTEPVPTKPPTPEVPVPPPAPNPTATGIISIAIAGLPAGVDADLVVVGPNGFSRGVTSTGALTSLASGRYTVLARVVTANGVTFAPQATSQDVEVGTEGLPVAVSVAYNSNAGFVAVTIAGLPGGSSAIASLEPPSGTAIAITGSTVINGAIPGHWRLRTSEVASGTNLYRANPAVIDADVAMGDTARITANYSIATGSIAIAVMGLPGDVDGSIIVTGPGSYTRTVTSTVTLTALEPGEYVVQSSPLTVSGIRYTPKIATRTLNVAASIVAAAAPVEYEAHAGRIAVSTTGLPAAVTPTFLLTGTTGSETLPSDGTTGLLPEGSYTLTAHAISDGPTSYQPNPSSRSVIVSRGNVTAVAFDYEATGSPGGMTIAMNGLPTGVSANVVVTGPSGYLRELSSGAALQSLPPGRYVVTVRPVHTGAGWYGATPARREIDIAAGGTLSLNIAYAALPVHVDVRVSGLPGGTPASISLINPSGSAQQIAQSTVLPAAAPGRWRLSATPITSGGSTYTPSPASYDHVTEYGDTLIMPVNYSVGTGAVAVAITGLPTGGSGSVVVTGPGGFSQSLSGTATITALPPGTYVVTASPVTLGGIVYHPTPASRTLTVNASLVAAAAPVAYAAQVGTLTISASGLPGGVTPTFTLTGTSGTSALSGAGSTDSLAVGTYTLAAATLTSGGTTYTPSPSSRTIAITAGGTTTGSFAYTAAGTSGSLAIALVGLGSGNYGDLLVTGPSGYSQNVTASTTLTSLVPGRYTITIRNVRLAQGTYAVSPSSRELDVVSGGIASTTVSYSALPAVVEMSVAGLPGGAQAAMSITPPSGSPYAATGSTTINPAVTGRWRLTLSPVTSGGSTYTPSPSTFDQTVLAGDTLRFSSTYAVSSGSIAISVGGLGAGVNGSVTVTGPGGYSQTVTSTTTLTSLTPGAYTVAAASVTGGGLTYLPTPASRAVTVTSSLTAAAAPVTYAAQVGRLTVATTGLAGGITPTFTLTGTSGSRTITGAGTTDSLAPGSYTLSTAAISSGGTTYTPSPTSASVTITVGATATSTFAYTSSGGTPTGANLSIEHAYVTQAVQNWNGTAKIVVGRDALVRVFVKAGAANTLQPDVRVRVYDGASLVQTSTITSPGSSVPTSIVEGTMSASWNVIIPAGNVTANLRVLVDVDPNSAISEADRSDNIWPRNGTPQTVATASVPPLTIKFIPVILGGLTGNVTNANKDQFLQTARRILPINVINSSVRASFTSNVTELQSGNGNGGWTTLLSEINALRSADQAPSNTHYFGVVKVGYSSGYAGFGYIPGRAAVGWDHMPSGDPIAAHELGHNFSRPHTPCGVSGDANYPYAGGVTGAWGWNVSTNSLVSPSSTDVMGYCGNQWVSDWTWGKIIDWRAYSTMVVDANEPVDGILIWGRVSDGRVVLEPAFRVKARATPRPAKSSFRVQLTDAAGASLLEVPIDPERVDHETAHDERHFAVVVPWSERLEKSVARIAVRDERSPFPLADRISAAMIGGLRVDGGAAQVPTEEPTNEQITDVGGKATVRWNASKYPMALVRDAETGVILSFLRKPGDHFESRGQAVDITFSDGVRSANRRVARRR